MSNTAAIANQNPRNPFPGWRLANGIINATANQLGAASDSSENWAWGFAVFVVVGVVAEVIIAICHPPYESFAFRWGSTIADVMVAAGIAGEIIFARRGHRIDRELNRRSNDKLEKAIDRAVRAEEQHAPRLLKEEQCRALEALKGKVSALNVTCFSSVESASFARQIVTVLSNVGITVKFCDPRIGLSWTDIYIVLPKRPLDFRSDPIYAAFKEAGISVGAGDRSKTPLGDLPPDIPVIMVGEKKGSPYPDPRTWPDTLQGKPKAAISTSAPRE